VVAEMGLAHRAARCLLTKQRMNEFHRTPRICLGAQESWGATDLCAIRLSWHPDRAADLIFQIALPSAPVIAEPRCSVLEGVV
jgi:hypothetical protein